MMKEPGGALGPRDVDNQLGNDPIGGSMRVVPTRIHGIVDWLLGGLLIALPWLLGPALPKRMCRSHEAPRGCW